MKRVVQIDSREYPINLAELGVEIVEVEPGIYSLLQGIQSYEIVVRPGLADTYDVYVNSHHYSARVSDPKKSRRKHGAVVEGRQTINAPMPGKVIRLLVAEGDTVDAGQGLLVVEAMKMQNEIKSPKAGKVVAIAVAEGAAVNPGQALVSVE